MCEVSGSFKGTAKLKEDLKARFVEMSVAEDREERAKPNISATKYQRMGKLCYRTKNLNAKDR